MVSDDDEWLTWPQAAELVGCPVPTIDWWQRQGRIESRPHHGNRPSLRRTSVEEFARWYAERAESRARRAQKVDTNTPPEPTGWLNTDQAAEVLHRSRGNVQRLVNTGVLHAERRGHRMWLRESEVRALLAARDEWVSIQSAADILGVQPWTVQRWAEAGRFVRRPGIGRATPSILRSSVEQVLAELQRGVGGDA